MTRDDIIRMAREAGLHIATDHDWMPIIALAYAQKFAELVAAAEREACAALCDGWPDYNVQGLAEAIRARGQICEE
jgi:hypothetical protein